MATSARKTKLAFIVNDSEFFLSHRLSLANRCKDLFDIVVILPKSPKTAQVREMGFRVTELPLSRQGVNPLNEAVSIFQLFRALRQEKPDIVHSFTIKPSLYGSLASRWAGVPYIVTTITGQGYVYVSSTLKSQALRPLVNSLYRWAFKTPKVRVIFQNPTDRAMFVDNDLIQARRTTVIAGSGVDPKKFFPQPEARSSGEFKILVPCRCCGTKGLATLSRPFFL